MIYTALADMTYRIEGDVIHFTFRVRQLLEQAFAILVRALYHGTVTEFVGSL